MDSCLLQTMQVKQLRWKTLLRALRTRSLGEMPCAQPAHLVPKRLQMDTACHLRPAQCPILPEALTSSCPALASEKPAFPRLSTGDPSPVLPGRKCQTGDKMPWTVPRAHLNPAGLLAMGAAFSRGEGPEHPKSCPSSTPTPTSSSPGCSRQTLLSRSGRILKPGRPGWDHFSALPSGSLTVC